MRETRTTLHQRRVLKDDKVVAGRSRCAERDDDSCTEMITNHCPGFCPLQPSDPAEADTAAPSIKSGGMVVCLCSSCPHALSIWLVAVA